MSAAAIALPHPFTHKKALLVNELGFALYAICCLVIGIGLITVQHVRPGVLGYATNISPADIIADTNIERQNVGEKPLQYNALLAQAAQAKAQDMFAKNYWAHFGPNGETPWQFIQQAGYGYQAAGENLARDFNDSNAVVQAWMNSPSHKENLLNANYQDIGVAVVNGTLLGHETTLVVQMFGKPYNAATALVAASAGSQTNTPAPLPTASALAPLATSVPAKAVAAAQTTINQPAFPTPQAEPLQTVPANGLSAFTVIRIAGILFMLFAMVFLVIDSITIRKRGVVRLASHSFSHVAVLTVIVIGICLLQSGKVL